MQRLLIAFTLILVAHLYVGYYINLDIHGGDAVFFVKKHVTLQIRFDNLYTRSSDDVPLKSLTGVEAKMVRDYCKYRLGIETWLESEEELEACKAR